MGESAGIQLGHTVALTEDGSMLAISAHGVDEVLFYDLVEFFPSNMPSMNPSIVPSSTALPSSLPTMLPSSSPTIQPSNTPTMNPSMLLFKFLPLFLYVSPLALRCVLRKKRFPSFLCKRLCLIILITMI